MSDNTFHLDWPHSLGTPTCSAGFRVELEDFKVDEDLGFDPDDEGEHLVLHVRKRDQNTRWLASKLAEYYGVPDTAVGYCGLKDRRAVTSQWFSVHLPKADLTMPVIEEAEILAIGRHGRKLRPGMHLRNRFAVVLRFDEKLHHDLEEKLRQIASDGVPNYFGEQRFGRDGNNLQEVARIVARDRPRFKGKRGGLYLSAARSWLFNLVLSARVRDGSWQSTPDGPLWGRGRPPTSPEQNDYEMAVLEPWRDWLGVLEHSGLKQERRELILRPENFAWTWHEHNLELSFSLPPGCYATALLREVAWLVSPKTELVQNLVV